MNNEEIDVSGCCRWVARGDAGCRVAVWGAGGRELWGKPRNPGLSWMAGLCRPLLLCEAQESLEWDMLGGEGEGKWGERTLAEPQGEEKAQKQLILLVELFL